MEKTIFYSDKQIIAQNEEGFIFNFIKNQSQLDDIIDYGFRIGMSPLSAKKFFYALQSSIGDYEQKNGEIKIK